MVILGPPLDHLKYSCGRNIIILQFSFVKYRLEPDGFHGAENAAWYLADDATLRHGARRLRDKSGAFCITNRFNRYI